MLTLIKSFNLLTVLQDYNRKMIYFVSDRKKGDDLCKSHRVGSLTGWMIVSHFIKKLVQFVELKYFKDLTAYRQERQVGSF